MSLGRGPVEKAFAIVHGYLLIGISLAVYMNILTVGTIKTAEKALRTAVRQQLLVVKVISLLPHPELYGTNERLEQVATFIIIELIIFPLGCGVILDLCTIWFFPEVSLRARLVFLQYAPLTATFYHWVVGTMFMFVVLTFSSYISLTLETGTCLLSSWVAVAGSCVLGRCGSLRTLKIRTCTLSGIYSSDPPLPTFTNFSKVRLCTRLWWFVE